MTSHNFCGVFIVWTLHTVAIHWLIHAMNVAQLRKKYLYFIVFDDSNSDQFNLYTQYPFCFTQIITNGYCIIWNVLTVLNVSCGNMTEYINQGYSIRLGRHASNNTSDNRWWPFFKLYLDILFEPKNNLSTHQMYLSSDVWGSLKKFYFEVNMFHSSS